MSSNGALTYEQIRLKIQEILLKIEKVEQRALDERKIREEAEREIQAIERRIQEAEDPARGLRWPEALSIWHTVYSNPKIRYRYEETQPSGFTTAIGRRHPKRLVHWTNFHEEHKSAFSLLCNQFAKPEAREFSSRGFYQKGSCHTAYWRMKQL